jgi:hypothetical protein
LRGSVLILNATSIGRTRTFTLVTLVAASALEALDADSWAVPLDPRDRPSLRESPEFKARASRIAARAPRTPHPRPVASRTLPFPLRDGVAAPTLRLYTENSCSSRSPPHSP